MPSFRRASITDLTGQDASARKSYLKQLGEYPAANCGLTPLLHVMTSGLWNVPPSHEKNANLRLSIPFTKPWPLGRCHIAVLRDLPCWPSHTEPPFNGLPVVPHTASSFDRESAASRSQRDVWECQLPVCRAAGRQVRGRTCAFRSASSAQSCNAWLLLKGTRGYRSAAQYRLDLLQALPAEMHTPLPRIAP